MANQIHIVPHFHWDREWYFTAEESRILLVNDLDEVMDMLETRDDYPCFVLDGQTAILEDYLAVKPENRQRLQDLIQKGRLIIGPWYTQTDEMVVGGESIVRNLLYGKLDCEAFGPRMMIGYLPDSFGQSARLPQILNGFGIERSMFWRGTSERMGTDKTEFIWKGDNGAKVTTQLLPLGYAIGKYLPADPEGLKERMDKYLPVLDKGATSDHILVPNGHDQMPVQKNIFDVMKTIEDVYPGRTTRLSRYEDVFEEIEKNPLPSLRGEFLDGKYMRVHRSIYSSRADLKSDNTRIENKITNQLEPLASIAYSLGYSYEHGLIENIWKEILKNHAHDSIGCCCSDPVHRAIKDRFFLAEDRTDRLITHYQRKIADNMEALQGIDSLTIYNTLPYARNDVIVTEVITKMKHFQITDPQGNVVPYEILGSQIIDAGLIDRQIVHYGNYDPFVQYQIALQQEIPAMGYRSHALKPCAAHESGVMDPITTTAGQNVLENEFFQIEIQPNGTLHVTDKTTHTTYTDVLLVEDGSDDGDGYDYSPLPDDWVITSETAQAAIHVSHAHLLSSADISFRLALPKDLQERQAGKTSSYADIAIHVTLKKDSPVIEWSIDVNNQAEDHRMRILIPNQKGAQQSLSDNQFGSILRPVTDPAVEVWEQEKWSERPDSIYPFLSYVALDNPQGLAALSNSIREYEVTGENDNVIALTLFRCTGLLGKENLHRRPGRPSGIRMETPDSQMPGRQRYAGALCTDIVHLQQRAKEYITPLTAYNKMPYNAMKMNLSDNKTPQEYSLMAIDEPNITISTLKKAEQSDALQARFYNGTAGQKEFACITCLDLGREMRLDETPLSEEPLGGSIRLAPNQTRTLEFCL